MKKSLHILADFYGCRGEKKFLTTQKFTEPKLVSVARRAGFKVIGTLFHEFPNGGITGLVLVSESHIALHTWPEKDYLTVDVFFCNFTRDNSLKVRNAILELRKLFQPRKVVARKIVRD